MTEENETGLSIEQGLAGMQASLAAMELVKLGVKIGLSGQIEIGDGQMEEFQGHFKEILDISFSVAKASFADALDELAETAPKSRAELKSVATFLRES